MSADVQRVKSSMDLFSMTAFVEPRGPYTVDFDLSGNTPRLTYTLHDVLGDAVWEPLVLTPDELRNGVRTWDRKADPGEVERLHAGYGVALPHSGNLRMVRHMIRIRALEQAQRAPDTQGVLPLR